MSIVNISNPERTTFRVKAVSKEGARNLQRIVAAGDDYAEGAEWEKAKQKISNILAEGTEVLDKNGNYIELEDRTFDNTLEYIRYLSENVFTQLIPDSGDKSRHYTDTREWNKKCEGLWTWLSFAFLESYLARLKLGGVTVTKHQNFIFAPDAGLHWENKTYRHILRSNMIHFIKYPTIMLPFVTSRPERNNGRVVFSEMAEQLFSRPEICTNKNYMEILESVYVGPDGNLIRHAGQKHPGRYGTLRRAVTTTKGSVVPAIQRRYFLGLMSYKQIAGLLNNLRDFTRGNFLKEVRK